MMMVYWVTLKCSGRSVERWGREDLWRVLSRLWWCCCVVIDDGDNDDFDHGGDDDDGVVVYQVTLVWSWKRVWGTLWKSHSTSRLCDPTHYCLCISLGAYGLLVERSFHQRGMCVCVCVCMCVCMHVCVCVCVCVLREKESCLCVFKE